VKPRRLDVFFNRSERARAGRRGFTNQSSQGFGRGARPKAILALAAGLGLLLATSLYGYGGLG
jgi:hypothetical protein